MLDNAKLELIVGAAYKLARESLTTETNSDPISRDPLSIAMATVAAPIIQKALALYRPDEVLKALGIEV